MKKSLIILAFALSMNLVIQGQEKLVVGYFANNQWNKLSDTDVTKLTHLNIAFANPDANGDMVTYNQEALKAPIAAIKKQGVKVLLSVAGGGATAEVQDIWAKYMKPENVKSFIGKTMNTLREYGYDGIDLDIEHDPFFNKLGANYAPYVKMLSDSLRKNNMLLTTALFATYTNSSVTSEVLERFDFINLMAYDATGNWNLNRPGQHSSIDLAVEGINFWSNTKGVPREKLILGLPFYGWDFDEKPLNEWRDFTFAKMVELDESYAYLDQVGQKYYNGIPTILTKTILSEDQCGGVMIWHISCDTKIEKYSLLNTIKKGQQEYRNNLARNKSTTSSELELAEKNPASAATDGNPTTRWAGKPLNPAYLTIDLGEMKSIDSLVIDWEDSYAKSFEIQVSDDNVNWETVKNFEKQELLVVSNHALQYVSDLNTNSRYLRLRCTEGSAVNGTIWCYSIWDVRVFEKKINTSTKEIKEEQISIYPNPATSSINIEGIVGTPIEIYSLAGNLILRTTDKRINIKHLQAGVYLLKSGDFKQQFIKK